MKYGVLIANFDMLRAPSDPCSGSFGLTLSPAFSPARRPVMTRSDSLQSGDDLRARAHPRRRVAPAQSGLRPLHLPRRRGPMRPCVRWPSSGAVSTSIVRLRLQRDFRIHAGHDGARGIGNIHFGDHGSGRLSTFAANRATRPSKLRPRDLTRTSTGSPTRMVGYQRFGHRQTQTAACRPATAVPAAWPAIATRFPPESSTRAFAYRLVTVPANGAVIVT